MDTHYTGENGKKAQEIEKLKIDLKDALNNQVAGEELKKLKAENAQLKKQNQKAIDKITKLEEEIAILNKGRYVQCFVQEDKKQL